MGLRRLALALSATALGVSACTSPGNIADAPVTTPSAAGAATPSPAASATGTATQATAGAPGIGDPDFPTDGNGGYDVARYRLKLDYDPGTEHLKGTAVLEARTLQSLSRFNLDLSALKVESVAVNDRAARFTRSGTELTVIPATPLASGTDFTVRVAYSGTPEPIRDADDLGVYGFIRTSDGAFVT